LKKERRHWSADDKIKLLRLHLIEKQAISKICDEAKLSPTQFYAWQEQLFNNGSLALAAKRVPERNKELERIEKLEGRLRQKDEVIAELLTEHIALKKELGDR
jgi:transposase